LVSWGIKSFEQSSTVRLLVNQGMQILLLSASEPGTVRGASDWHPLCCLNRCSGGSRRGGRAASAASLLNLPGPSPSGLPRPPDGRRAYASAPPGRRGQAAASPAAGSVSLARCQARAPSGLPMARGGHGHRDCDGGAAFEVPLLSGGGGMIVARPNQRTCRGGISAPTTLRLARGQRPYSPTQLGGLLSPCR
jgi:hypothetical protein